MHRVIQSGQKQQSNICFFASLSKDPQDSSLDIEQSMFNSKMAFRACFTDGILGDLLHLMENTFDRKRFYANPSSYPNLNSNSNINPSSNPNPNPKAQLCFRTDKMTSFFDQM